MGTGLEQLIWLPVIAIGLALLAVFAISFRWAFRARRPPVAIGLVSAVWLCLSLVTCGIPKAKNGFNSRVWKDCEQAYRQLPGQVPADSVLDESAGLTTRELLQLLTERGLRFVEVRLANDEPGKGSRLTFTTSYRDGDGRWRLPTASGQIARVSVGSASDPLCVSIPESAHAAALKSAPFLPDSCIRIEYAKTAMAELALVHEPARPVILSAGSRQLLKRSSGEVLARLPSAEARSEVGKGSVHEMLRRHGEPHPNCLAPLPRLAELLYARDPDWQLKQDRVVIDTAVALRVDLGELLEGLNDLPVIRAELSMRSYRGEEFNSLRSNDDWARQVVKARETKAPVPYGDALLDLERRHLLRLTGQARQSKQSWHVQAANGGFFAFLPYRWRPDERNILVRIDRDGAVEWVVAVVPPRARGGPINLTVEDGNLLFWGGGDFIAMQDRTEPQLDYRSQVLTIPLSSLPAMRHLP